MDVEPSCSSLSQAQSESEKKYAEKYELLLKEYERTELMTLRIQNRLQNIRFQIRDLMHLKRLLIQRLCALGDRFMDVCLEIPDLEPGAMVEDAIIDRVADVHFANPLLTNNKRTKSDKGSGSLKKMLENQ